MNPAHTPLLLIAWRRPHTLRQVIDAIRPVAPTRLYVACDGPNPERPGEAEKVAATRAVIDTEIDWPCSINRLYSNSNQGCRFGPIQAITWFFSHVELGIILEDDIIPSRDFLLAASELLLKYKSNKSVMGVSAWSNEMLSGLSSTDTFFKSHLGGIWGWATWRRAWLLYQPNPKPTVCNLLTLYFMIGPFSTYEILKGLYLTKKYGLQAWDYQWVWSYLCQNGYYIVPRRCLAMNVGFGLDATHTTSDPFPITKSSLPVGNRGAKILGSLNLIKDYYSYYFFCPHLIYESSLIMRFYRHCKAILMIINLFILLQFRIPDGSRSVTRVP